MNRMMKMMLGAMLLSGIAACSNENIPEQQEVNTSNVITAYVSNHDSRVTLNDTGSAINVEWKNGDKFSLVVDIEGLQPDGVNKFNYTTYTYTHDNGYQFTGNAALSNGTEFYAFYPAQDEYWRFPVAFSVYGIDVQAGVLDENLTAMYAKSVNLASTLGLEFQHLTAIMKTTFSLGGVDVTGDITELVVNLPSDVYVGGGVNLLEGASFLDGNLITVTPTTSLSHIYIYLPKGLDSNDEISFTAMIGGDSYTGNLKATKTIEVGKVYPVNGIQLSAQSLSTNQN